MFGVSLLGKQVVEGRSPAPVAMEIFFLISQRVGRISSVKQEKLLVFELVSANLRGCPPPKKRGYDGCLVPGS